MSISKKQLETLRESGASTRKMAATLGVSQTSVMYWLKRHNLSNAKVKKKANCMNCDRSIDPRSKYCGNRCKSVSEALEWGEGWKQGDCGVLPKSCTASGLLSGKPRTFLFHDRGLKCERCEWTYTDDGYPLPPLDVSHRDNDFSNNSYDNLELLCPNCHAVETRINPTKRGEGRWSRGADPRNR
jgi:Zn finger protein HypA/HybF involved in hydrogenase expression